jgi:hypothetical protein
VIRVAYPASGPPALLLEGEGAAFVDRDWLQDSSDRSIAALAVDADGQLHYGDRRLDAGGSPEGRAASIMSAFVEDLLAAVEHTDRRYVKVTGAGLIAVELRRHLGALAQLEDGAPSAVVELTGSQAELVRATQKVAPGGLIVLAGESTDELNLDVYADVHRRGLRVLGVPLPVSRRGDGPETLPKPVSVRSGEPLPPGLWYRVDA